MPFMNYWTAASGFFISGFVFLSFLPVVTAVASWIALIICTGLLSFHTWICYVTFPVECWLLIFSVFSFPFQVWWYALVSPHSTTNSCLSLLMFSLSHYYKKCLDGYDDTGLCFCVKVTVFCPLGCVYLHVTDITWYFFTPYSHQHMVIFFGFNILNLMPPWDDSFIK